MAVLVAAVAVRDAVSAGLELSLGGLRAGPWAAQGDRNVSPAPPAAGLAAGDCR